MVVEPTAKNEQFFMADSVEKKRWIANSHILTLSYLAASCMLLDNGSLPTNLPAPKRVEIADPPKNQAKNPKPPIQIKPKTSMLLEQANQYAKDGLYREAISSFKKYLADNPKDFSAKRTLGIIYVRSGSFKGGIQLLSEAWPHFKEDFELNYYLAEAHRTQNRFSDAIFHYKQALLVDPNNLRASKALTWSYYSIRYYSEALNTAKHLKKIAPDDFQVSIIQARIMNKIGINDKALVVLTKSEALASPSELAFLYSAKADILSDLGETEKAEQFYRRALQDQPLLPGALTGLAKIILKNPKNTEQGISYLERALRIKPNHLEAIFLLAQAYEGKDQNKSVELHKKFTKEAEFDPMYLKELNFSKNFLAKMNKNISDENDNYSKTEDLEDQL